MVDHFRIARLIGRGGNGEVFLARDMKLGRRVALKIIRTDALSEKQSVERFIFEARATARFAHPHIVTVFAVGEHGGLPYVALEYLEGQTLRQRIQSERPSTKEALRIGLAIAEALKEAHRHGILHRDLKPENVILPKDGRLRVVDFGLAKRISAADGAGRSTESTDEELISDQLARSTGLESRVAGTPAYMAPEQWMGKESPAATDVWALGVLMYELIAGRRPFEGDTLVAIATKVAGSDPPPPLMPAAELPAEVTRIVERSLEKHPRLRPAAAEWVEVIGQSVFAQRSAGMSEEKSPFRGLLPFGERHADLFFGRDAEIGVFLERLREDPILPVVGPSGAGKSSFVQAGVIPRLREQGRWVVIRMRPGQRPLDTLALRLLTETAVLRSQDTGSPPEAMSPPAGERAGPVTLPTDDLARRTEAATVAAELARSPRLLSLQLRALAEHENARVLLFVDQLEELYTLVDDPEVRRHFMQAICTAADDAHDPVRVIFTVRDDFLGKLADSEEARQALSRVTVLRTPGERALDEILQRPVEVFGYRYEDKELLSEMVASVRGEPAALPLLQFACGELWDARDRERRLLLRSVYRAMGGVPGALATHADGVLASLSPKELHDAREILLRLVTPEATRRVLARSRVLEGLDPEAKSVLDRLIQARLLSVRSARHGAEVRESEGTPELELAHESLIQTWGRLSRWIDEGKEELSFLADLTQAAEIWSKHGASETDLWRGPMLLEAERKLGRAASPVPDLARRFIVASQAAERRRTFRRRATAVSVFALISGAALLFYTQRDEAASARRRAEDQLAHNLRQGAESSLDRGDLWEARAKLRGSLELADSLEARALWMRARDEPLIWRTSLPGHLFDVVFTPDEKSVAVLVEDGTLRLLDRQTIAERRMRSFEDGIGRTLARDPTGRMLAFGELGGGRIGLRNVETGALKVLLGHTDAVSRVAFSGDGRHLVSASRDGTVRLWAMPSGAPERVLAGHTGTVYGAILSPDSGRVISWGADQTIRAWEVDSAAEPAVLITGIMAYDLAVSPDGQRLAVGLESGPIEIRDAASGRIERVLHGHRYRVTRVVWHPRGQSLVSASWDRTVRVWSGSGKELRMFGPEEAGASGVALSVSGDLLAAAYQDGVVRLWRLPSDPGSDEEVPPIARATSYDVAVCGAGGSVAVPFPPRGVGIIDLDTGRLERILDHGGIVDGLSFSPACDVLASSGRDGTIRLWDPETRALRRELAGHTRIASVAFAPDGKRLVSASFDQTVRVWDAQSGAELGRRTLPAVHSELVMSHRGDVFAVSLHDGAVEIHDVSLKAAPVRFEVERGVRVDSVAFSPDDRRVAALVTNPPGVISVWDRSRGTAERIRIAPGVNQRKCLLFDSTGRRVIYGPPGRNAPGEDPRARILDLETGEDAPFLGADFRAVSCKLTRAGDILAVAYGPFALAYQTATRRPKWGAPVLLAHPAELLSQEGWRRLDRHGAATSTAADAGAGWRRAALESWLGAGSADGRFVCLATFDEHLERWDRADDKRVFREPAPRPSRIGASPTACYTLLIGALRAYGADGAAALLAADVTAFSVDGDKLTIASRDEVLAGAPGALPAVIGKATPGAIALRSLGEAVALGFSGGRIEVTSLRGKAGRIDITAPANAASLAELAAGPAGTLVAGYSDGAVRVFRAADGTQLASFQLYGPIAHLLVEQDVLHAATQLGRARTIDLQPLTLPYCDLLAEVWAGAPASWKNGAAVPEVPPADRCRPR